MLRSKWFLGLIALVVLPASAQAQATRTWVSGVGDDANPCSRTAPCKTFAGAISKTAAQGEIDAMDPGGFGTLTITKSITIDGNGFVTSTLNAGTNGFNVNAGASDVVIIRNLTINGAPGTGVDGIRFNTGAALIVENVSVERVSGKALNFQPSGNSRLYVSRSSFLHSAQGIFVSPVGAGTAKATIENSRLLHNALGSGLKVENASVVNVKGTVSSGNTNGFMVTGNTALALLDIDDCQATSNTGFGVTAGFSTGAGFAGARVAGSLISGNGTGVFSDPGKGSVTSFGTNKVVDNSTNGSFDGLIGLQ
jgi:hypothetical protein